MTGSRRDLLLWDKGPAAAGHLEDFARNSSTSSDKDLYKISPGSPHDLLKGMRARSFREDGTRISTRASHKGLYKIIEGSLTGRTSPGF